VLRVVPLLLPRQKGLTREANFSGRPATTWGTVLTSHTVANQFPTTFTQLIASTTYDADWVHVGFHNNFTATTISDSLVTIYIGAGGAEQVLIPNLLAGWVQDALAAGTSTVRDFIFPLYVPAGSRLSARHQSSRVSTGVTCMIELLGGGRSDHWTGEIVEAVGAVTASSRGTQITPGTTAEGTLTSIGTNVNEWGYVLPMNANTSTTTMVLATVSCDLAGGSATSALLAGLDDFLFSHSTNEFSGFLSRMGRFCTIPASTTLHARLQTSNTADVSDLIIYGVA
jgi:hypothetical protein